MSKYTNDLHINYQKAIKVFINNYPEASVSLSNEIDAFSRSCAIMFWKNFDVDVELFKEALNEIYTKESNRIIFTSEEVDETRRFLEENEVQIKVPKFFEEIVSFDKENNTNYSRAFASGMQLIFLQFTLIDAEVTFEEARLVTQYYQLLTDVCDSNKIKAFKADFDPFSYVTKNGTSSKTAETKKNSTNKKTATNKNKSAMEALNELIGLSKVKNEITNISNFEKIQALRKSQELPTAPVSYHLVFTGNPGTGKTTVARLVAQIYKELGVLSNGQLVEADSSDLVAGYVGQTAIKTHDLIQKAKGGVLFIDEAYTLVDNDLQGYGQEAIDTLLKEMEDYRDDLVVIVAGYNDLMQNFIESNPGLKSRFNRYIQFDDYNSEEMYNIFELLCKSNKYKINEEAKNELKEYFQYLYDNREKDFGNGRAVRNHFENIITKQANRISNITNLTTKQLMEITLEDVRWEHENQELSLEESLEKLNSLIGLSKAKSEVDDLISLVQLQQMRKAQGLSIPKVSLHLVFTGNPGTGKTTVARNIAQIYKSLGLVSKGQLVEIDRSGLVAGYVGQTAIKTQEVINQAIGGVLFIDEAYTLATGNDNDFGQEAIDTLLKAMEDYRDDLVVIVAGYDDLMQNFIESNPGLKSRFNRYIHFEDYSAEEMMQIFEGLCDKNQYQITEEAQNKVKSYFEEVPSKVIGNGRGVRNIFEKTVTCQAKRIAKSKEKDSENISTIVIDDIAI